MTQETIDCLTRETVIGGKEGVRTTLQGVFPEYVDIWHVPDSKLGAGNQGTPTRVSNKRHGTSVTSQVGSRVPFSPSSAHNSIIDLTIDPDTDLTPRSFRTLPSQKPNYVSSDLQGFTIRSLLEVPHLNQLADLVVDEQSRKEEKRRRRRIRDGEATAKDLSTQSERKAKGEGWRLTFEEKEARIKRLVRWVIRGLSEEGVLVQVTLPDRPHTSDRSLQSCSLQGRPQFRSQSSNTDAYIPLPEILLLPLIIPHIEAETHRRSKTFMRRTDSRYGHGILLPEIISRLRGCGEDGRWERVGEWCVEDALNWGEQSGQVKKVGNGWAITS